MRPQPHIQMMDGLAAAKRAQLPFDEAWDVSWKTVIWPHDTTHRRQWKAALRTQRPEIEAAYRGLPTRTAELFRDLGLTVLFADEGGGLLDAPRAMAA